VGVEQWISGARLPVIESDRQQSLAGNLLQPVVPAAGADVLPQVGHRRLDVAMVLSKGRRERAL